MFFFNIVYCIFDIVQNIIKINMHCEEIVHICMYNIYTGFPKKVETQFNFLFVGKQIKLQKLSK